MKRLLLLFLAFLLALLFLGVNIFKHATDRLLSETVSVTLSPTPTLPAPGPAVEKRTLFVPYWSVKTMSSHLDTYDRLIYFGITPDASGIDTTDAGYTGLPTFVSRIPSGVPTLLTVRMVDPQYTFAVLQNKKLQQQVIADTLEIAKEDHFSGVVLDLEVSALPFDSVVQQINGFEKSFATAVKAEQLTFAITLYGDTFYRIRPFDVKTVTAQADEVIVMAYDFHKASGNPGPNFPLGGADTYEYDLQMMTDDFLRVVSAQKVTVAFGMFGYDWPVDAKNHAVGSATSLSDKQIEAQFISTCSELDCVLKADPQSAEKKVEYTTSQGERHVIWFEDSESAQKKQDYLKTRGIGSVAYWAYSYF